MESGCHGRRRAASQGEAEGGAKWGGGLGGVAAKKGQKGQEATPQMTLT
jgi:hypothetical protein